MFSRLKVAPDERVKVLRSAGSLQLHPLQPPTLVLLTLMAGFVQMTLLSPVALALSVVESATVPTEEFGVQRVRAAWLRSRSLLESMTLLSRLHPHAGSEVPVRMVFAPGLSIMTVLAQLLSVPLVVRRTREPTASRIAVFVRRRFVREQRVPP